MRVCVNVIFGPLVAICCHYLKNVLRPTRELAELPEQKTGSFTYWIKVEFPGNFTSLKFASG